MAASEKHSLVMKNSKTSEFNIMEKDLIDLGPSINIIKKDPIDLRPSISIIWKDSESSEPALHQFPLFTKVKVLPNDLEKVLHEVPDIKAE